MSKLSYILQSAGNKNEKTRQLKELIAQNAKITKELNKKSELTSDETRKLYEIAAESKKILETSLIKSVEIPYVKLVQEVIHNTKSLGLTELFSYDPVAKNEKEKGNYATITNETVVYQENRTAGKFITGSNPITVGLINDAAYHENSHVLKIKKQGINYNVGFLHEEKITDEYTVSAQFRLNRFPSKVFSQEIKDSNGMPLKILTERITTRRTDILSLNYSDNGSARIEFGAMAPHVRRNGTAVYDNKYAPYSICASISAGDCKYTVYTDYKFAFKETQYVTLKIKKIPAVSEQYINDFIVERDNFVNSGAKPESETFQYDGKVWGTKSSENAIRFHQASLHSSYGDYGRYTVSLSVNGITEEIGGFYGKCWGSNAGKDGKRTHDMIASGPGFMPKEYREEIQYSLSIKNAGVKWDEFLTHFEKTFSHTLNTKKNGYPKSEDVIILSGITANMLGDINFIMSEWNNKQDRPIRYTLTPYTWQSKSPIKHKVEQIPTFVRFDFSTLYSITSAPGNINWAPRVLSDVEKYRRIYNKYNYKMNNGIDIGAIRVYAQILTEKTAGETRTKALIAEPE